MQRILAHKIIYKGKEYKMHIAELSDDGRLSLYPYKAEIHSTTFISGTIQITIKTRQSRPYLHAKKL